MIIQKIFKSRLFYFVIPLLLIVILLFSIILISSSIHSFAVRQVENFYGSHHVIIKADKIQSNYLKKVVKKQDKYYLTFKKISKTYEYTNKICKKNTCSYKKYNKHLLDLYLVKNKKLKKILIFTVIIILMFSYLFIYNSYKINYQKLNKSILSLKMLGMCKKQLYKYTFIYNTIILIISLFIGSLLSIWLSLITLLIINYLLKDLITVRLIFNYKFIFLIYIFIVIISYISNLLALFNKNKNNYKIKIIKKKNLISKLAYYNYHRSKKKYIPITIIITISITIFTTFSMYLHYGLKAVKNYDLEYKYEVILLNSNDENHKKLDNFSVGKKYKVCNLDKKINNKNVLTIKYNKEKVIGNKSMKINNKLISNTKNIPFGLSSLKDENIIFLTNNFNNYCNKYYSILFIDKKINNFKTKINTFALKNNLNIQYVDYVKANNLMNNLILSFKIVLYIFLFLMILISISSIINVVLNTMNIRKNELLTLKTVGITKKQMNRMLLKETCYILRKTYIISFLLVLLIAFILYIGTKNIIKINFIFPYNELIISFIFIFFLIYFILHFYYSLINKKDIINYINEKSM